MYHVEVDNNSIFDSMDKMKDWLANHPSPDGSSKALLYPSQPYRDSVYIKGDFTASYSKAAELRVDYRKSLETWDGKGLSNKEYSVPFNNCGQVTMELFMMGTLPSGINVGAYINEWGVSNAMIPNWNMINLQIMFYNKALNLDGFNTAIQAKRNLYEGKNSITQWWYSNVRENINTISPK